MRTIQTPDAPPHTGPVPQAVEAGGWIFVSALFGADPQGHAIPEDARGEAEQLFANLTAILAAADADLSHVVRVGIVMRNLQALSAGARVTACWKLAPEVSGYEDPYSIMELFYGKLLLMDYAGATLRRKAAADTFALMAERLRGVERVERIAVPDRPALRLFEVHRPGRGPLLVAWIQGDPVSGEEQPPQSFTWDWPAARARAVDALGQPRPCTLQGGQLSLSLSVTPLFVDAAEPGRAEFRGGASEHAAGRA